MFLDLCSSRKPGRHQLAGLCGFAKEFVLAWPSVPLACAEGFSQGQPTFCQDYSAHRRAVPWV